MKFLLDQDVPDDLSYLLEELNHEVTLLRKALPGNSSDEAVLHFANDRGCVPLSHGVIVIRRRTRAHERAALLGLLERAGETGLLNNVNFV